MDQNGIITKVQRRGSEQTSDAKAAKLVCHICSEKAKMKSCVVCNRGSCYSHSMALAVQNVSRICDVCFREQALEKMKMQSDIRDNLAHEISAYAEKRDSNTQNLNKISAKFRVVQKDLQDKDLELKKTVKEIEEKIEKTKKKSKIETQALPAAQRELLKYQMDIEIIKTQQKEVSDKISTKKAELDILVKERTVLVSELNEVSDFIRNYVPVKIIRQVICNPCYQQVRHAFVQMFRPVVQIKDEVKPMPVHNPQSRKGMCTTCKIM